MTSEAANTQADKRRELPRLLKWLTDLRRNQGWAAEELAELFDFSKGTVYNYEKGRALLSARSLGRLLRRFKNSEHLPQLRQMVYEYLDWLADLPPLGARGPRPHVDRSAARRPSRRRTHKAGAKPAA